MRRTKVRLLLKTLAEHMRERRKSLGLSQEQLADRAGLSPNYVAKLELEKRAPSLSVLNALADALEVTVSELLSEGAQVGPMEVTEEIARVV
ncbi:MAG: helix-turn-helix domain-containing protein, partial [Armatimonadota bacterium]